MIDSNGAPGVLRSNQAIPAPQSRKSADRDAGHSQVETADVWPEEGKTNLLVRVARAARLAVHEARRPSDFPLPHLYRGRDLDRRRDAA